VSDATVNLHRQIATADDLQSVVRTMKGLAAASIGQYETAVRALADYYRSVELGLAECIRETDRGTSRLELNHCRQPDAIGAVVFGSDQGLVGQFNEVVADYAVKALAALAGTPHVWAVGERVSARLADAGLPLQAVLAVPASVAAITSLVEDLQIQSAAQGAAVEGARFYVFHNRPQPEALYEPVSQRLLPLDVQWEQQLAAVRWPTRILPEVLGAGPATLRVLIREYLFISLFRACAESLASENASRLAAMQRAERNIGDLLTTLNGTFHRVRQGGIDEELFDVIAGFEALGGGDR
jgi:F-type H+-transporting ATPase subunit gamma